MYDLKSEAKEFIADTPAEALAKARSWFGLEEAELTVKDLTDEAVGGLTGRALLVAQPTATVGQAPWGGGRDRDRDRGGRGRDRDRDRGRGRDDRAGRGRDRDRERGRDRDRGARADARPEPSAPSVGTAQSELEAVGKFVLGLVERMDLGPFEIASEEEEKFIIIQLNGEAASALAAGDDRAPEAIQLLANQAAARYDDEPKRVVVDVEGNRERREAFLSRVADRAAKRAMETGRAVALDPMNAKDRRGIHVALRDSDAVATMSIGEGRYRQVVVVPEGAADYEEARRASEAASTND